MNPLVLEPPPPSSSREHEIPRMLGRSALASSSFGWLCLLMMPIAAIGGARRDKWLWLGAALALTVGSLVGDVLAAIALAKKGKDGKFVAIVALLLGVPGIFVGLLTLAAWVSDFVR